MIATRKLGGAGVGLRTHLLAARAELYEAEAKSLAGKGGRVSWIESRMGYVDELQGFPPLGNKRTAECGSRICARREKEKARCCSVALAGLGSPCTVSL
jgi:hypothetical protein